MGTALTLVVSAATGIADTAGIAAAGTPPMTIGTLLKIPPGPITMCWSPPFKVMLAPASRITWAPALRCSC
ncbi:hypothetical protein D3C84_1062160 [compost metagenome]